jgi:hypothetical protein
MKNGTVIPVFGVFSVRQLSEMLLHSGVFTVRGDKKYV